MLETNFKDCFITTHTYSKAFKGLAITTKLTINSNNSQKENKCNEQFSSENLWMLPNLKTPPFDLLVFWELDLYRNEKSLFIAEW